MLEQETESEIERLINESQEIKSWGREVERHTETHTNEQIHTYIV